MQLYSGILGKELPISRFPFVIAVFIPGIHLTLNRFNIRQPSI